MRVYGLHERGQLNHGRVAEVRQKSDGAWQDVARFQDPALFARRAKDSGNDSRLLDGLAVCELTARDPSWNGSSILEPQCLERLRYPSSFD